MGSYSGAAGRASGMVQRTLFRTVFMGASNHAVGAAAVEVTGGGVELGVCATLCNCLCKKHAGGKLWCCGGSLLVDGRGIAFVVGVYAV